MDNIPHPIEDSCGAQGPPKETCGPGALSPSTYLDVDQQRELTEALAQSSPTEGPDEPEVVAIAVMGPTGTGKSTFVNLTSGSDLRVGDELESCTNIVQFGEPFDLDGRRVFLVDTPGFDDTVRSDVDVLDTIANFLATTYEQKIKLAGVLYFHRISDVRMSGTPVKNFKMFRKLCGESALRNVVIVTNMWGGVDHQVGERREAELKGKDKFFKPVLEKHAQMTRHEDTIESAQRILRLVLHNHPLPLRIQVELVDEGKELHETSAGEELNQELSAQIRKHKKDMRALEEQMQQAMRDKDEEIRMELEEETKKMWDDIKKAQNEAERLAEKRRREREGAFGGNWLHGLHPAILPGAVVVGTVTLLRSKIGPFMSTVTCGVIPA